MARKTKEDAEKTRTRILASALALFTKKGYDHTTFTDIAARLKMTKGAVYWHFASKEDLLKALIDLALNRFHRQLLALMPAGELSFPTVAKMMVDTGMQVTREPRSAAFFKLMKCQIRWTDASMDAVRQGLLTDAKIGPKQAFKDAIGNDVRAKRVRADVNAEEIAAVCLAVWDGVVQAQIDGFLTCDLEKTLYDTYDAVWKSIAFAGCATGKTV